MSLFGGFFFLIGELHKQLNSTFFSVFLMFLYHVAEVWVSELVCCGCNLTESLYKLSRKKKKEIELSLLACAFSACNLIN